MLDKLYFDQINAILSRLTSVVQLLDEHGCPVIPDSSAEMIPIPIDLDSNRPQVIDNRTWLAVKAPPIACVLVHGTEAASVDCALLVQSLLGSLQAASPTSDRNDACRSLLRDELSAPEIESVAHENGMPMEMERAVIVFHALQSGKVTALELLRDMIPAGEDDLLVEIDRHTLALVKSMAQVESLDELQQLAEAVEQTALSETAARVTAAIGEPKSSLAQIGESYREAWRALEVGHAFKPEQNIYLYRRLTLERFLMEIPRDMGQRYNHILFNRKTSRLFNEEMLHTIEMFFAKDLNLSDTARQLYIHRNTLVYRLDKVQRQTGLDLRHFDDAITFRMLFLLGKSGGDQPTLIR
ncbi:MAG: helix-turn-helix domain-containing protein [Oscillospiraceae bacterium]|nr:helix-turn-helix domain-containing protein [Oscillospiraceae bacterium]